ncbi:MAG: amidohydrolase family protein [Candidatus Schekmanbacteria bacterium]|nr:amidohydrolase family protein [Candidatus Schekmanbacteria bacterium]
MKTVFDNRYQLAELPYFRLLDGERLVLSSPELAPIVDMHTHFALTFVLPNLVDLEAPTPYVQHYLPAHRRLDLDVYLNKNFSRRDLVRLKRDLTLCSFTPWGMRRSHTAANLSTEMADLGISHSAVLPIDFPFFLSHNARTFLRVASRRREFIGFGSVHPRMRNIARKLDQQIGQGARGIKVHPAAQMVAPEDPCALELYHLCGQRKLPVLWHCGPVGIETRRGRELTQVARYRLPIEQCRETTFILGHAGALQWEQALDLAVARENVYLELSSQSLTALREIFRRADPQRLLFGTDWPFYHQAIQLAKVFLATEGNATLRRLALYGNAARLFGLPA